jgi:hypothetical protein
MPTVVDIIGSDFLNVQGESEYYCRYGEAAPVKAWRLNSNRISCPSVRHKPGKVRLDVLLPWQGTSWHLASSFQFNYLKMPDIQFVMPMVVPAVSPQSSGADGTPNSDYKQEYRSADSDRKANYPGENTVQSSFSDKANNLLTIKGAGFDKFL